LQIFDKVGALVATRERARHWADLPYRSGSVKVELTAVLVWVPKRRIRALDSYRFIIVLAIKDINVRNLILTRKFERFANGAILVMNGAARVRKHEGAHSPTWLFCRAIKRHGKALILFDDFVLAGNFLPTVSVQHFELVYEIFAGNATINETSCGDT
jgi:hypothetical protein